MTMLTARSEASPALASHFGRQLCVAWIDPLELHVMMSSDRGAHWQMSALRNEFSRYAPALCEHSGYLYIAWTGTDQNQSLNVMRSSDGGLTFTNKVTIPNENSQYGPALVSALIPVAPKLSIQQLVIFWVGTDPQHQLNLMTSQDDGAVFHNKQILGDSSVDSPTAISGEQGLTLAWTDVNRQMHVTTNLGSGNPSLQQIDHQESHFRPALFEYRYPDGRGTGLTMAFSGTDDEHSIYALYSFDPNYADFNHYNLRQTLPDSSPPAGPTMAALNPYDATTSFLCYVRGDNHHLNLIPAPHL